MPKATFICIRPTKMKKREDQTGSSSQIHQSVVPLPPSSYILDNMHVKLRLINIVFFGKFLGKGDMCDV